MAISIEAPTQNTDNQSRKTSISERLMEGITSSKECAQKAQELIRRGKPKEGYLLVLEGMKRFEGQDPSLLPLYNQFQRGHLSELIREQEQREQRK